MDCGKCKTEMKEGVEVRNGIKVKIYKCPKCSKELEDYQKALQARRAEISKKRQDKLKEIKGGRQRMIARRKL